MNLAWACSDWQGYTPPAAGSSEYQSIPMDKIEDFGAHANSYYPLKIEIFKTQTDEKLLDLLWNKYWVATLSQSNIISVSRAIRVLSLTLRTAHTARHRSRT